MAVNASSIDQSEWTFTYDLVRTRSDQGQFVEQMIENPWAFLRFGDVGEERKYWVPINQGAWQGATGLSAGRLDMKEFMPYLAWPLESARPPRGGSGGDINFGGAWAVNFCGWV